MINAIKKQGSIFIGIAFTFLFCFATIFYFERLNSDAGYYFFHTVNTRWFHVEHGRLVLLLAETLPTIGSILHLPLKVLAVLYSLNHVLFFLLLTLICLNRFRNLNAAILITVLQFAGLKYSVFTPQFELYYGLALLIFAMAYIQYIDTIKPLWSIKNYAFYSLLLVFIFTSHPMAVYCYLAGITIYFSDRKHLPLILHSILFLVLYLIWKKLSISTYEQSKFSNFNNAFSGHFISHYLSLAFLKKGCIFLFKYYADVLLICFAGLIYFLKERQYKKAVLQLIFFNGTLLTIWLMFEPGTMGRYIEQVYFPFVWMACLWLFKCRLNFKIIVFLFFIVSFRICLIINTSFQYRERAKQMAQFSEIAQNQTGTKFYVTESQMGKELYEQGNWSFGFETLIYSAMHCHQTVTITKLEDLDFNGNKERLKPGDFLFRPFDIIPIQSLNAQYFKLEEGKYEMLLIDK